MGEAAAVVPAVVKEYNLSRRRLEKQSRRRRLCSSVLQQHSRKASLQTMAAISVQEHQGSSCSVHVCAGACGGGQTGQRLGRSLRLRDKAAIPSVT